MQCTTLPSQQLHLSLVKASAKSPIKAFSSSSSSWLHAKPCSSWLAITMLAWEACIHIVRRRSLDKDSSRRYKFCLSPSSSCHCFVLLHQLISLPLSSPCKLRYRHRNHVEVNHTSRSWLATASTCRRFVILGARNMRRMGMLALVGG